tara:strand:+ start:7974 stop:8270 length:297 start_codon:yes stop_codon:yes gene_type:complete
MVWDDLLKGRVVFIATLLIVASAGYRLTSGLYKAAKGAEPRRRWPLFANPSGQLLFRHNLRRSACPYLEVRASRLNLILTKDNWQSESMKARPALRRV